MEVEVSEDMDMKKFLHDKAKKLNPQMTTLEFEVYEENIEKHYLDFLDRDVSYIYKVAILARLDGNKRDFATVYIGLQRSEDEVPQYLGCIDFPEGENMDCSRTLFRILDCIKESDTMFDDN